MRHLPALLRNTGLTKSYDSLFDNFFNDFWKPLESFSIDSYKTNYKKIDDKNSLILIEMPGFNKKDINVEFKEDDHLLTITAERKEDQDYYTSNRYNKQWTLNEHLKVKEVKLRDGVLKIFLEDASPPEKEPLQIEVK